MLMRYPQAAATLAYNTSLHINKDKHNEPIIEGVSALAHALDNETDAENGTPPKQSHHTHNSPHPTAYRMLMAFGRLLYRNDEAVAVANTLEIHLSRHTGSTTSKVKQVASEVQSLLAN